MLFYLIYFLTTNYFARESLALLILPEGKWYRFIQVIYNKSQAIPLETRLQIKGLF